MARDPNTPAWARMEVVKAATVGRFLVDLVLHPDKPRPKNVAELKSALGDAVNFYDGRGGDDPLDGSTPVEFIDTPMDRIKIRLPPMQMIEAAVGTFDPIFEMSKYPMPKYLADIIGRNMTAEELFYARIGDYSTAECA